MVSLAPRAFPVALGLLLDAALGDPPTRLHPVGWFGTTMTAVERWLYADSVVAGGAHAGIGAGLGLAASSTCRSTAAATAICTGGRSLVRSAHRVADCLDDGDLGSARTLLPNLVGRDPVDLDEQEVTRAVIESVAENTVDAIVAPAMWALAAGAPAVFIYRALNTMDAMVGYRNARYARYGRVSARLDDAAGWLPARLTAFVVAVVRPSTSVRIARAVRHQAPSHPSPNSGVAEAAYAAALGVQLGGTNSYGGRVDKRPLLGSGPRPRPADIRRATTLTRDVTAALVALLLAAAAAERMNA